MKIKIPVKELNMNEFNEKEYPLNVEQIKVKDYLKKNNKVAFSVIGLTKLIFNSLDFRYQTKTYNILIKLMDLDIVKRRKKENVYYYY